MSAEEEKILSYRNVPVNVAAEYLGVNEKFIRCGIAQGSLPIGNCIKAGPRRRSYYISPERLIDYRKNNDRPGAATPERSGE